MVTSEKDSVPDRNIIDSSKCETCDETDIISTDDKTRINSENLRIDLIISDIPREENESKDPEAALNISSDDLVVRDIISTKQLEEETCLDNKEQSENMSKDNDDDPNKESNNGINQISSINVPECHSTYQDNEITSDKFIDTDTKEIIDTQKEDLIVDVVTVTEIKVDDKVCDREKTLVEECEQVNDEKLPESTQEIYDITEVSNGSDSCNGVNTLSQETDGQTEEAEIIKAETKEEDLKFGAEDTSTTNQKMEENANDNLIDLSDYGNNSVQNLSESTIDVTVNDVESKDLVNEPSAGKDQEQMDTCLKDQEQMD